jgi:hypothetical protein
MKLIIQHEKQCQQYLPATILILDERFWFFVKLSLNLYTYLQMSTLRSRYLLPNMRCQQVREDNKQYYRDA